MRKLLNIIFVFELAMFGLIILGIMPRWIVPYFVLILAGYVIFAPIEDGVTFFVRSIPFFIAIPVTATFDNFNTWRIISAILFLKWFFGNSVSEILEWVRQPFTRLKKLNFSSILLIVILLFAILSITQAENYLLAVKRGLYFINLSLIGIVAYDLFNKKEQFRENIIKNLAIPTIIVAMVGLAQVVSTYFVDIYQFMALWGEGIQCRQFGAEWCNIAVRVGNTWLAYFGDQLSLRVFSLFPDSHSFPIFLLLGLPSVFVVALKKLSPEKFINSQSIFKTASVNKTVILIPVIFLAAILSGTRGIWAAGAGTLFVVLFLVFLLKKYGHASQQKIFTYLSSYLILFFLLFTVAFPIFASPQFLVSKGNSLILRNRIKSIIDFGETSNSQRIEIWKKSLVSIVKHPLLGVGIGNFPVVLKQDLRLAKAGSSAHNLYLQIAAEMGIPALFLSLCFFWLLIKNAYQNFIESRNQTFIIYNATALIFIPWVLLYLLTDAAIFDERAFLIFVITAAAVLNKKTSAKTI